MRPEIVPSRVAPKTKSLARNNKTGCRVLRITRLHRQNHVSRLKQRAPTMNRDDVFLWLSLFWFVALCAAAIRAFISLRLSMHEKSDDH
jgi:hypothetical protein